VKENEDAEETTLESEVQKIVDSEDIEENDMLKGKPHNNHVTECGNKDANDSDENFETTESVKFNEDGDIELDADDVIDESTMTRWLKNAQEII
jgi:hypothetical protein